MSFDRDALAQAIEAHGPVIRVVVADVAGSTPREVGASLLVWRDGQSGTIGGGTLEFDACATAREMLSAGTETRHANLALGPDMGQCCGGRMRLLWERYEAVPTGEIIARPMEAGEQPLSVTRALARARDRGEMPSPRLIEGWFIEPVSRATTPVWVWGAGHVGRAIVAALAPLPDLKITWVDTAPDRFPDEAPEGVTILPAPELAAAMRLAPAEAHHLILTFSHALDLALCDAALAHGFASAGLIGSATKWARFRARLGQAGHAPAHIDRITCPIGDPRLGKHPSAIALGVAHRLCLTLAGGTAIKNTRGQGYDDAISGA